MRMAAITPTSAEIREAIVQSVKFIPDDKDLKPEQKLIVEYVVHKKDVFAATAHWIRQKSYISDFAKRL